MANYAPVSTKPVDHSDEEVECLVESRKDATRNLIADQPKPPQIFGIPIKYLALVLLTVQNASQMLFMRYAKMPREGQGDYLSTTAVVMQELLKLTACVVIITLTQGFSGMLNEIYTKVIRNWKDTLLVSNGSVITHKTFQSYQHKHVAGGCSCGCLHGAK